MPNPILKQAVVIGAGMGGLAAAKAVAAHFEKVIVFDRDALLDPPEPRPGTPQARHTHGLLAGGCRALESLFPGIELDLVEAGEVDKVLAEVRSLLKPRSALREPELASRVMSMMAPA
jgi:2-polyprenyl-6-methoxyphenol hydroxylase-like FAD-dependent oxidoreductase